MRGATSYVVAFLLAALAVSAVALAFALLGCSSPWCRPAAGGPTCEQTRAALAFLDDYNAAHGLARTSSLVSVEWVAGDTFVEDGAVLRGLTTPTVSGALCRVAARGKLPSWTSLAHELQHVAIFITHPSTLGDPHHARPEWTTVLPNSDIALSMAGL